MTNEKINKINEFRDGGTIEIITTERTIFIDYAINTKTPGKYFLGRPKADKSNIIKDQAEIDRQLMDLLLHYRTSNKFEMVAKNHVLNTILFGARNIQL